MKKSNKIQLLEGIWFVTMVMDVSEPIGYEWYRGNPLYTHEVCLKLWEVTEQPNHTHWAPSNYYEIV